MIKENSKAPNFKLPSSNNKNFEIGKSLNQYLVIYFYPRDNTPGCTNEAIDFSKLYKEFKKLNCEIVGISKDSIESHRKFISKFKIPFHLLSDEKILKHQILSYLQVTIKILRSTKVLISIWLFTFIHAITLLDALMKPKIFQNYIKNLKN